MMDGKTATTDAKMTSGQSRAEMFSESPVTVYQTRSLDPKQIGGHLTFNLAAISDFITQNQIEGVLNAEGDLRFDHLQLDGTIRSSGSQLKYRGMILQSLGLDAVFKGEEAEIRNFRLRFDPDNYVDLAAINSR